MIDALSDCRKKISATIVATLGFGASDAIEAGTPDAPIVTVPNATVVGSVDRRWVGARRVEELMTFTVTVRQAKPSSGVVEDFKIAQAKLLGEALLAVDWRAECGAFQPFVSGFVPSPTEAEKRYVEWALVFTLLTEVFQ